MSIQFSIFLILFLQYCAASKESNAVLHFSSSLEAARRVLAESGIPPLQSPLSSPPLASRRPPLPPLPHLPLPSAPPPLPSARVGKLYPSTFVLLLPISAVAFVFICTFIWSRNLRSDSAEAASSNLWSLSSPNALVPALASQIHGNNTTVYNLGLDLCLLNKLPTFLLPAMKTRSLKDNQKIRRKDYYTCAVCICDYEEGETLKLLPACGHSFHKDCIDIWLFSHSTCPLCRLSLFNSKGDLILLEEEQELEYNSVVDDQYSHLATTDLEIHEPGNTSTQPLVDNHILISPLIRMFRRTQSCINSSQADQAAHSGAGGALNFLRRSCSQPAREHKVHPVQSFS